MGIELESCPLCGGKSIVDYDYGSVCVRCTDCGCHTAYYPEAWAAVKNWNTRYERTCSYEFRQDREEIGKRAGEASQGYFYTQEVPMGYFCSECGRGWKPNVDFPPSWWHYCPECGSKVTL